MKTLSLLAALSLASVVSACSSGDASAPGGSAPTGTTSSTEPPPDGTDPSTPTDPGTKPPTTPEPKQSATPPLRSGVDKDIIAELTKAGIDVAALPDTLEGAIATRAKREAIMKGHRHIFISNDRNAAVDQWDKGKFAMQLFVSFIFGVDTDSSITHDGFGTNGGNDNSTFPIRIKRNRVTGIIT